MRLAIVSPFPPEISGVGQYGARLAEGMLRAHRFSEVCVYANQSAVAPVLEHFNGLTIRRVWRRGSAAAAYVILRSLVAWQPDVVWFNLGLTVFGQSRSHNFCGLSAPMLAKWAGLPTVVTLHEIFEAANLRALGAVNGRITHWGGEAATRFLLNADTVCLTLRSYVRLIQRHYHAHNVMHLPHGTFDPPRFAPIPSDKRILIFGTYAPYKGLPELIEIYRGLRAADSALVLTIAGSDHPRFPGYLAEMQARAADLPGLEWRVGVPENHLPALFESARVIALPYTATTGASSVVHRAASHGRPVVAYGLPDLRTVAAEEGLRIEFVPPGDHVSFAARLLELLNDPVGCERIGRANVAAMQVSTLDVTCRRYIEIFEAAVQRRAALGRPVTSP